MHPTLGRERQAAGGQRGAGDGPAQLHALTNVISTAVLLFVFTFVGFLAYAIIDALVSLSNSFTF